MKKMKKDLIEFTEYKILLLGESGVGKTTIFTRYISNNVDKNNSATIGVDFEIKTLEYKGKKYSIKLFDTAGQERFQGITKNYYRMGDAFLIIFDLTNEYSLKMIHKWIETVKEEIDECKFLILGNKCDLKENLIPSDVIDENLKNYKNIFIKTSVLKNKNIKEAFEHMINLVEYNTFEDNNENQIVNNNIPKSKLFKVKKGKKKHKNMKC